MMMMNVSIMAMLKRLWLTLIVGVSLLPFPSHALYDTPVHGFAMHGEPKYPADFTHFEYVNPDAPVGGTVRLAAVGGFDTFNPFNVRGQSAAGLNYLFETLTVQSQDEAFTEYGLIAETILIPSDRSFVEYRLRPEARFHDGSPITAADVQFSFEILRSEGRPFFRFYYANVQTVEIKDEHTIRFSFDPEQKNMELPLILGQLPVLSKNHWENRDFSAPSLEIPMGSGPYRIRRFEPNRFISLERDPDYWGWHLPVNRGLYNFQQIRFDYYRDATVALEAFKARQFDARVENRARDWALAYDIPELQRGELIKREFPHERVAGMQGYVFNLRRPLFQDARVRRALAYAFDFEWSNRNLFFDQYIRTRSYFDNSELAARALPADEELALLERHRDALPPEVFTTEYAPPQNPDANAIRENLKTALDLLQAAGWRFENRRLVNADNQPFTFEILLDSPAFEPITLPFTRNLERLGITATVRTIDPSQYENRVRDFDFDVVVNVWGQSSSPGNEQRDFWGSVAAETPGSRNLAGLQNAVVDALVEQVIAAPDRASLIQRVRALDRVLQWQFLVIPHWHVNVDRVAYWNRFGIPETTVSTRVGFVFNAWWLLDAPSP